MPFAVRCPDCSAKLKLEEKPDADEAVGCPKCGSQFTLADARAADRRRGDTDDADEDVRPAKKPKPAPTAGDKPKKKKKKAGPAAPDGASNVGVKRRMKTKKSNKAVLYLMIAGAFVILGCVGGAAYLAFGMTNKIVEMCWYVPEDCNHVRGLNVGQMRKYKGFIPELDRQLANGPVKDCSEVAGAAVGLKGEDFLEYSVVGKNKGGGGTVVVMRSKVKFDPAGLLAGTKGQPSQAGGQSAVVLPASAGQAAGGIAFCPTNRLVVVVLAGAGQADFAQKSGGGGPTNKDKTFAAKLGATGKKITGGNIWLIVRQTGTLQGQFDFADKLKPSFGAVVENLQKAPMWGCSTSYGAKGLRYVLAMQMPDPERAREVANQQEDKGPLKDKDDSEIPNALRDAYSFSTSKEFREFLSNLKFSYTGDCAYMQATVNREKSQQFTQKVADPTMFDK